MASFLQKRILSNMNEQNMSIADIVTAERDMVLAADQAHSEYFTHAMGMVTLMNNLVASIDKPDRFLFVAFLSLVKKHLTLALFSVLRRHHVEGGMNLRQVLEGSAWAAYALAFEDSNLFQVVDAGGKVTVPDRLSDARNAWLTANYPVKSEEIKRLKKKINESVAHANIAYAFQTFGVAGAATLGFTTSFFDGEDDFRIKVDLLMVANFAMGMIDLFVGVNQAESVFQLPANFPQQFGDLVVQHNRLREEVKTHPRFRDIETEV